MMGQLPASLVQTVNAGNSLRVTTTQEMLNDIERDSPNAPEVPEEFPNDAAPTEVETEQPPVEIEAAPSLSEQ